FVAQTLRFVDHERCDLPSRSPLTQHRFHFLEESRLRFACPRREAEPQRQGFDELVACQPGVVQIDATDVAAPFRCQGCMNESRLSCANLADQYRYWLGRRETIYESAQRLAVTRRQIHIVRVRCELERQVLKIEELRIHAKSRLRRLHVSRARRPSCLQ